MHKNVSRRVFTEVNFIEKLQSKYSIEESRLNKEWDIQIIKYCIFNDKWRCDIDILKRKKSNYEIVFTISSHFYKFEAIYECKRDYELIN